MNYVEKILTLPKEESTKSIIDVLNSKALDALAESVATDKTEIKRMKSTLDKYPDLWPVTKIKYKNKMASLRKNIENSSDIKE